MKGKTLLPLLIFLVAGFILTLVSLFFPQQLGSYKKVSGWPLAVYEINYKKVVTIENRDLVDQIIQTGTVVRWEIMVINILIWLLVLESAWIGYRQFSKKKDRKN